jgi:predicted DNA-binding protein (MmcQ/YjbR family)
MDIEEVRLYCLEKKSVTEGFPFGDDPLVFKVGGKMFALLNLVGELRLNLKCDPERAIDLRERYQEVIPGYHMSKKHWNTIKMGTGISSSLIKEWIDHSYDLILMSLPLKTRKEIEQL